MKIFDHNKSLTNINWAHWEMSKSRIKRKESKRQKRRAGSRRSECKAGAKVGWKAIENHSLEIIAM